MRQGQQNRRGRGRPNNNRGGGGGGGGSGGRGQNPLTRSFESNGPDVKIRGTPSHIAEKYITLARDALSTGDIVMAENYLQHAEHYNRIIMAYREQMQPQGEASQGGQPRHAHSQGERADSRNDADDAAQGRAPIRGSEPQPAIADARPREPREPREGRDSPRDARDQDRPRRNNDQARNGSRPQRPPRGSDADEQQAGAAPASRGNGSGSRITDGQDAPGFLKTSVAAVTRRRRSSSKDTESAPAPASSTDED